MRSAVYRRIGDLRAARVQTRTFIRPLSSSTYDDQPTPPSFPLYRPAPTSQPLFAAQTTQYTDPGSLHSERKIRKATKIQLTEKAIQDLPELEEDDLRSFYAAVMESGRPLDSDLPKIEDGRKMSREQKAGLIEGLATRLMGPVEGEAGPSRLPSLAGHRKEVVMGIVERLRAIQLPVNESEAGPKVSLGLVSKTEWAVLLDEMAGRGGVEAENMLDLMSTHGTYPDQNQITQVMEAYAREGRVGDVARIYDLLSQSGNIVSDSQRDLLVEAHLRHSPPLVYPAVNLVQSLATTGKPLPQSSYNILLSHLTTSQSTSQTRSLAWDLFANMRLTAHPTPDPSIYSTMISACASSREPQPERARDLWIELNESTSPERREYDAIIRALSSTKSTYLEAFDLFRQMLAKHTEETFVPFEESNTGTERWSRFVPTAETFNALLEGTKRAGDLNRARWVLKEVVRLQGGLDGRGWKGVDEELMSGVFMTYASWKPIVRRQIVREGKGRQADVGTVDSASAESQNSDGADPSKTSANATETDLDQMRGSTSIDQLPNPAHTAPQTSADAIREAKVLFDQIIQDTQPDAKGPFNNVRLSTRLINSYLSVHLAHSPNIASAKKAWDETWALVDERVKSNGWSMMQVLERCSAGELGKDREEATIWAKGIWEQYLAFSQEHLTSTRLESTSPKKVYNLGLGPRQIERSYRSIIRALSLSNATPTKDPMTILRQFHSSHPPTSILDGYTATPSTPFQIRMIDRTRMAESDIPPHILWGDIDVLHQRLVREGRKAELGWLKWVCKSYEVALRKRRRWRLKGKGEEGRVASRLRKGDEFERVEGGPMREEQESQEPF